MYLNDECSETPKRQVETITYRFDSYGGCGAAPIVLLFIKILKNIEDIKDFGDIEGIKNIGDIGDITKIEDIADVKNIVDNFALLKPQYVLAFGLYCG